MSDIIKDGGPAFPQPNHIIDTDRGREEARGWMQDSGLTKRELFAAMALNGILAGNYWDATNIKNPQHEAVSMADALLDELSKPQTNL